jgi:phospholipid/cholesterol/gamma-HCH transport system permease protein
MSTATVTVNDATLSVSGVVTHETVPQLYARMRDLSLDAVREIDCSSVAETDSAGIAFIEVLSERAGPGVSVSGLSDRVRKTLALFSGGAPQSTSERARPGLIERVRSRVSGGASGFRAFFSVAADSMIWSLLDAFRRGQRRKGSFVKQSVRIGVESIGIIGLLSFIIGFIVALQSAAQLRLFGANIYVVNLLALFVVREMGPLLTAVLVAGRSGSSIASEIATMKVTEELDALQVMGLQPIRYVVVPKVLAITAVMPVLTMISMAVAVLGGMAISLPYLDLTARTFLGQFVEVLSPYDLLTGFSKSVVFAWAIVVIAAYYGFQAKGGAEGVGLVTTKSVVASIFSAIIIDVFFSFAYLT